MAAGDAPRDAETRQSDAKKEQLVTPWEVAGGADGKIDYSKLTEQFGCSLLSDDLIARIEKATGVRAHPFLRRRVFFAHRDLEQLLDAYEKGEPFYLYTGRGPSSESLHFGHMIPFMFTKWLQDAFNVPLVIQITDDEKYLWKGLGVEEARRLARENIKDIIACGFDVTKTFIFSDFEYVGGEFYRNIVQLQRCVSMNQVRGIFGFTMDDYIGKISFPAVQAAPAFPTSFPHIFRNRKDIRCLIPCAIDQDPYFRMTRDAAPRLGFHKPALLEARFFPAMAGESGKMSASDASSAIYVSDDPKTIETKVKKYVFSGGGATLEEHRERGADLTVDISWQWLNFFLDDDAELGRIGEEYGSGRMTVKEIKKILSDVLIEMNLRHQQARSAVTDDVLDSFMSVRDMAKFCG